VLTGLRLSNIALIERLELSFREGFTVLTGETGAGKSILLDALDALLGGAQGSAGARLLRRGAERGVIEASFEGILVSEILAKLKVLDLLVLKTSLLDIF
jgi:DNA repair protein RecN (Recombination protein N)